LSIFLPCQKGKVINFQICLSPCSTWNKAQNFTVGLVMLVSPKDEDPPDFVRSQSDSCPHRDLLLCRGS
jgi:hypothetical protein